MYRTEPPRHEPMSRAVDRSSRAEIVVTNGVISRLAFPCYYMYRRDGEPYFPHRKVPPIVQDHRGWPDPQHRDRSFQPRVVEGLVIEPIHLEDEGYTSVTMVIGDSPSGITWEGSIDDFVIRVELSVMCDEADSEELVVPFSVYAEGTFDVDGTQHPARDVVTSGTIRVLPAPHDN